MKNPSDECFLYLCIRSRFGIVYSHCGGFPGGASGKNPPANAGELRDAGSILGSGKSPGEGHGNPLQRSCLENPMDRGAWWAAVYGAAQSRTQLK